MVRPQDQSDRSGINRYGEKNPMPDYYEDEFGMRHPRVPNLEHSIEWSADPRSESSTENHRGKGPRNFVRTDDLLREEVCEAFIKNSALNPEDLDVTVQDGVVTLTGRVYYREDKYLAEDLALSITGVKDVVNLISRGKWDVGDNPGGLIKGIR